MMSTFRLFFDTFKAVGVERAEKLNVHVNTTKNAEHFEARHKLPTTTFEVINFGP